MTDLSIVKEKVVNILVDRIDPIYITMFGSFAKGTTHSNSDIDIAFLPSTPIDHYETFLLAQEIANEIKIEVDLINLKEATTVMQAQIVGSGDIIYCKNERLKDEFQMLALKMYAKLNEERKPILDAIKERGSVYG